MDNTEITCVEWFAGYCGNHIGLRRTIPNLRLIALCEIEAFAVANLVAKMENGWLESIPIWTDCKTFPTEPFVDRVGLFVASYPCQPFSSAGKRKGKEDERHLWPYVRDWASAVRPGRCFFENVEGHVSLGLSTVVSDMEEMGYEVSWGLFSASEVGAPHQRKRVFIYGELADCGYLSGCSEPEQQQTELSEEFQGGDKLADNNNNKRSQRVRERGRQEGREKQNGHNRSGGTLWPSRLGEEQEKWEPPRVV